jgi:hypothetical protein
MVCILVLMGVFAHLVSGNQRHAAQGARRRMVVDDLRVHRADVLR